LWHLEKNPEFASDFPLIALFLRNTTIFSNNSFSRRLRPSREDRSHCFMRVFITKLHLCRFFETKQAAGSVWTIVIGRRIPDHNGRLIRKNPRHIG
jgi:hypothetical protein